jgi:hypothetical protein
METANLTFRMTHPVPFDLDAATALARAIVDQVSGAAPSDTWRAEENADPVTVDHLKELVIPNETSVEGRGQGLRVGYRLGTATARSLPADVHRSWGNSEFGEGATRVR